MIKLNGKDVNNPKNLRKLLSESKFSENVCVIVNGKIIPRDKWKTFKLKDGDVVEVVGFVGGG